MDYRADAQSVWQFPTVSVKVIVTHIKGVCDTAVATLESADIAGRG